MMENSTITNVTGTKNSLYIDCGNESASAIEIPPRSPPHVIISSVLSFRSFLKKNENAGSHNDMYLTSMRRIAIISPIINKLN